MITIKELYKILNASEYFLSDFSGTFWIEYMDNHTVYDRLFARMYSGFSPWEQSANDNITKIKDDFIIAVHDLLQLNEKEFDELYKLHVLSDDSYSLTNDFKSVEIMDRDTSDTYGQRVDLFSNTSGARTDDYQAVKGSQSDTNTEQVAPFDSETFHNNTKNSLTEGQRVDTGTNTKGIQNDSGSNTKGTQSDSHTEDYTLTKNGYNANPIGNLNKHKDFWSKEDFYAYIFGRIAEELLIIE